MSRTHVGLEARLRGKETSGELGFTWLNKGLLFGTAAKDIGFEGYSLTDDLVFEFPAMPLDAAVLNGTANYSFQAMFGDDDFGSNLFAMFDDSSAIDQVLAEGGWNVIRNRVAYWKMRVSAGTDLMLCAYNVRGRFGTLLHDLDTTPTILGPVFDGLIVGTRESAMLAGLAGANPFQNNFREESETLLASANMATNTERAATFQVDCPSGKILIQWTPTGTGTTFKYRINEVVGGVTVDNDWESVSTVTGARSVVVPVSEGTYEVELRTETSSSTATSVTIARYYQ